MTTYMNRECTIQIETKSFGRWIKRAMRPDMNTARECVAAHWGSTARYINIATGEVLTWEEVARGATFAG